MQIAADFSIRLERGFLKSLGFLKTRINCERLWQGMPVMLVTGSCRWKERRGIGGWSGWDMCYYYEEVCDVWKAFSMW